MYPENTHRRNIFRKYIYIYSTKIRKEKTHSIPADQKVLRIQHCCSFVGLVLSLNCFLTLKVDSFARLLSY